MGKTLRRASLSSFFVCLLGFLPLWAQAPKAALRDVAFYLVAHPDDWQLFMGSHAYDDVQRAHTKVVFICLSAGQADDPGTGYWQAREAGCRASVQQLADARSVSTAPAPQGTPVLPTLPALAPMRFGTHSIASMRYKNTAAYFLRLPDGGLQGQGFARYKMQCIKKLRNGMSSLTDVEGINTYASWNELRQLVGQIVQKEKLTGRVWMNTPETDEKKNPGDHTDHRLAGQLGLEVTATVESCQQLYVGYNISKRKANLSPVQSARQTAAFSIYCQMLTSHGQPTSWDAAHRSFLNRQYYRTRHTNKQAAPALPIVASAISGLTPAGLEEPRPKPATLVLEPNYPNPFDQASQLVYQLPKPGFVTLRVYDMQGRVVKTLVQEEQAAGRHEVWLEVDQFPASGQYIGQLQVAGEHREQHLQINR